jgi:hypothetical protein
MAYGPEPTMPTNEAGLSSQAERILERLAKIKARLSHLVDSLHGPIPTNTPKVNGERQAGNVKSYLSHAHAIIGEIDQELDRLEGGL